MLESIYLKFSERDSIKLNPKGTTIFVGANGSGKSLALREIKIFFDDYQGDYQNYNLLERCDLRYPTSEDIEKRIADFEFIGRKGLENLDRRLYHLHNIPNTKDRIYEPTDIDRLRSAAKPGGDKTYIHEKLVLPGVILLNGRERFALLDDAQADDLLYPSVNLLTFLLKSKEAREEIRKLVKEALDLTLIIDWMQLGTLKVRLSSEGDSPDELTLNQSARDYYGRATHIKNTSDGIQAFVGIVTAVHAGDYHTVLVDEPEAFLHPPLARKLGKILSGKANGNKSLIASTHSADFLMGCLDGSSSVQVVRLDYRNAKSRAWKIDASELRALLTQPLVRSANVISGLFYDGVVVTESDNDRVFYSEIYYRIAEKMERPPAIHFVNAQNKQTVSYIIGPLRRFGVPAVAITDIDVIKKDNNNDAFAKLKTAAQIPFKCQLYFDNSRSMILNYFKKSGKSMNTDGGIGVLSGQERREARRFIASLEYFGLFVVRGGELESWLPKLGVPRRKKTWTIDMLQKLGSDPSDQDYVSPGKDDVWAFMRRIVAWIDNPERRGLS